MSNKRPTFRTFTRHSHMAQFAVAVLVVVSLILPAVQPAAAQEPVATPDAGPAALQVANDSGGVQVAWRSAPAAMVSAADAGLLDALAAQMPFQRYQGYDLPLKVIPLRFSGPDAVMLPQITRLETVDLPAGLIVPGAPELPPVILDEGQEPPVPVGIVALPEQPVFVLRQGVVKGEYLVMVAVSPIFVQNGVTKLATVLETNIPGANAILVAPWEYAEERTAALEAADAAQPASEPTMEAAAVDAATATVTVVVANPGIQRLARSVLAAANAAYTPAALANVRLTHRGVVVPVQIAGDELRFYVESVGDRWNTSSYYQIALESDPARRSPVLPVRALTAPVAGPVSTVVDRGEWKDQFHFPSTYGSNFPGADVDHYFSAIFNTRAATDTPPTVTANLRDPAKVLPRNTLPLVGADATFTFQVTPNPLASAGSHYEFSLNPSGKMVSLDASYGPTVTNPITGVGNPGTLIVSFVPQGTARSLYFESIGFARPVSLAMAGRGALFWGNPTQTTYVWSGAPQLAGSYVVWDVTDPTAPVALTGAGATGFADSLAGHRYIVAGPDFVHTPTVRAWSPLSAASVPAAQRAHALYMIPDATYAPALKPLLDLRGEQGIKPLAVDVTRIYDAYSFGYVDSRAIRHFLQDAYKWTNPRPVSVVLVGDGTFDPKNYEQRERAPTLMPPYMVEGADDWLGEIACDNCYGRLSDTNPIFTMDLMVGRFPIKTVAELTTVVGKVVSYETATDVNAPWHSTALYLADNYLKPVANNTNCPTGCPDGAGNFAQHSDGVRALNPNRDNTNQTPRVYYHPFPQYQTPPATGEWWRSTVREDADKRAIASLQDGPAVVVYNGHANVFYMGELEKVNAERAFLLGLNDASVLYKSNQLYVQLSMTCMTASFASPANSATTIDEAFFLSPRGGAVAVWGSTGQSVVRGHEALQEGFFKALFAKLGTPVRLGNLLDAGYLKLVMDTTGNEDILYSFLLLGDPLTRLRYNAGPKTTYIPVVSK